MGSLTGLECHYKYKYFFNEKQKNPKLHVFIYMETKKCNVCNIEKNILEFHKWKYGPDGYKRECKECRKTETKIYYSKNSDKIKSYPSGISFISLQI